MKQIRLIYKLIPVWFIQSGFPVRIRLPVINPLDEFSYKLSLVSLA